MLTLFSLLACTAGPAPSDTDPFVPEPVDGVDVQTFSGASGSGGKVQVPVVVDGQASFLVSARADGAYASLEELRDPSGEVVLHWSDWYEGPRNLTNSFFADFADVAFAWPIREDDGPLADGEWTVVLATTERGGTPYVGDVDVDAAIQLKQDDDLGAGVVHVRLVYAQGLDTDPVVTEAVDLAIERWREIWAAIGLDLEVEIRSSQIDPELRLPDTGYAGLEVASDAIAGEVVLLIGDTIDGDLQWYGFAGGIPGPMVSGGRAGVVVGWMACAGQDLEFDADEIELMAETMAHEVGHFQGLMHPVEDSYAAWDALDDTPECSTRQECNQALGRNFMFPYSICDATDCLDADQITADQAAVVHRYLGTL